MNRTRPPDANKRSRGPVEATVAEAIRHVRRVIVAVVGATVLVVGVVMIVTPGPALVFIPLGLAILAIEFAWARRLLKRVREQFPKRKGNDAEESETTREESHG